MHVVRKLAVLALVVALAVVAGLLRPGQPTERTEGYFLTPGGLVALPSFMPAFPLLPAAGLGPGISQILPAFAPASGPGSLAIVTAICPDADCPGAAPAGGEQELARPTVTFTMTKVFPFSPVAATFTANGEQELICQDDASCDLTEPTFENWGMQSVAVGLTGGGENETLSVTACYDRIPADDPAPGTGSGDCRSVMVTFVETIFVAPPIETASGAGPTLVAYKCDDANVGRYMEPAAAGVVPAAVPQNTPEVSWEELFDWFFATRLTGLSPIAALRPTADQPFYRCGADTALTGDDRVTYETDLGILSADWAGDIGSLDLLGLRPFGTVSPACDAGDSVDILDHPGPVLDTRVVQPLPPPAPPVFVPSGWCDLDFAPNGVVVYPVVGTGADGVATVTAQQSGGAGPLRTVYPSFTGGVTLTLVMEGPDVIGMEGGEFTFVVLDPAFRFLGGETVECSAEPKDAVLAIIPQTATSGVLPEPFVVFTVYPTMSAVETGVDVTITCIVESNRDVMSVLSARIGQPDETVELVAGCNPVASTWPDGTPAATVAEAVSPADALDAIWALDPGSGVWQGFSPDAPEASDLESVDELDAFFACMSEAGAISRPAI